MLGCQAVSSSVQKYEIISAVLFILQRFRRSALLGLLVVASCSDPLFEPHHVRYQDEAAAVDVAATMIAPWGNYVDALSPGFNLSATDALTKALPTTQSLDQRIVDILTANIALKGPQPGATPAQETAPTVQPSNPTISPAAAALVSGLTQARPTGQDPILQYSTATALLQEVTLLNKSVKDAALRHDYVPYIARMQVSVRPFSRNLPYDLHLAVSFFTGDGKFPDGPRGRMPYILPILVTDDLEGVAHARTVDQLRQLDFAASGLINGFGIGAAGRSAQDKWQNVIGTDLNGVITVGRESDNTMVVRLGAMAQPNPGYGMVSRAYSISLVILVPREYLSQFAFEPRLVQSQNAECQLWSASKCLVTQSPLLQVVSHTVMREVLTGKPLATRLQTRSVREALLNAGLPDASDSVLTDMANAVQANSMKRFKDAFHGPDDAALMAWTAVASGLSGKAYRSASLQIPYVGQDMPDSNQTVLVTINKGKAQARIGGISSLDPTLYSAALEVPVPKLDPLTIYADSLALDSTAHVLTATFPVTEAAMAKGKDGKSLPQLAGGAFLSLRPTTVPAWRSTIYPPQTLTFNRLEYPSNAPQAADFSITAATDTITAAPDGSSKLRLMLSNTTKGAQVALTFQNATVGPTSPMGLATAKGAAPKPVVDSAGIILPGDGAYDVALQSLTPGRPITITAVSSVTDSMGVKTTKTTTLNVNVVGAPSSGSKPPGN